MKYLMLFLLSTVTILVGLLGSGSAVAEGSDWQPLAVGNSWTYSHRYSDQNADYSQWTNYIIPSEFTLSVLRTEVLDDTTYFVISDMPEFWPPVPLQFIAGKKLRWAGDQLMERTADGEQALFLFGGANGARGTSEKAYAVKGQDDETIQVVRHNLPPPPHPLFQL